MNEYAKVDTLKQKVAFGYSYRLDMVSVIIGIAGMVIFITIYYHCRLIWNDWLGRLKNIKNKK